MNWKTADLLRKNGISFKANDNIFEPLAYEAERDPIIDGIILNMICSPEILLPNVEKACQDLLDALLIDTASDHNTKGTAARMAKMFITEVFAGRYQPRPEITTFENVKNVDQLFTVGPATVRSACSHHFVPMIGEVWFGILPEKNGRVLGLSKFSRLADWVFRRPQIQEEATAQLADLIENTLQPRGLAVVVRASHLCVTWRGVKDNISTMITSDLRGALKDNDNTRAEFFNLIKAQGF